MNDVVVLKGNTKFNKGLVMPQEGTYLELTQDEMEYVDGGVYINHNVCVAIAAVFAGVGVGYLSYKTISSKLWKIGLQGTAIALTVSTTFGFSGLVSSLVDASFNGKGVDVSMSWWGWVIAGAGLAAGIANFIWNPNKLRGVDCILAGAIAAIGFGLTYRVC